jgi:hypothetical protein
MTLLDSTPPAPITGLANFESGEVSRNDRLGKRGFKNAS